MQFSLAFPFLFRVLQSSQTTVTASDSGASGSGTLNGPPTQFWAQAPPVLSGSATIGGTLATTTGTWTPTYGYTYSYHWNRCTPSNSFCATLDSTGSTYAVTSADAGCTLTAIVTATAGSTSRSFPSATSPVVQPGEDCIPGPTYPLPAPPQPIALPTAPPYAFADSLPSVRQSTIRTTICATSWTRNSTPPAAYTNALKIEQMKLYGEQGSPSAYREDQLIPLELGGAPRSPKNLWPEPRSQSKRSRPLETALNRGLCAGALTLAAARRQILLYKRTKG